MSKGIVKSEITCPTGDTEVALVDVAPGSVIMGVNGTGPYLVLNGLAGPRGNERALALLHTGNALCCAPMNFKVRVLDVQLSYRH